MDFNKSLLRACIMKNRQRLADIGVLSVFNRGYILKNTCLA